MGFNPSLTFGCFRCTMQGWAVDDDEEDDDGEDDKLFFGVQDDEDQSVRRNSVAVLSNIF